MNVRHNLTCLILACALPMSALAAVTELVIESREILNGGAPVGDAGPYEKLRGYAIGEIDPTNPQNAVILNLDKAERNANGLVGYRVEVEIQKPLDLSRGNGTLLYDVVNRGNKLAEGRVLYNGMTLVWSGWQGALVPNGTRLTAELPLATEGAAPFTGLSREEFIEGEDFVGDLEYPSTTLDESQATLTIRLKERDPRVPYHNWEFLNENQIRVVHPGAPYDAGTLFEFIHPARDPILHAVGFAATRDVNSYLRYELADSEGNPNPLGGPSAVHRAMAMGISQSGRMLRHFLYLGFNQDEAGRQVFDGAFPIIPGSRKTWTNTPFAKPGWWSKQHEQHLQAGDQFPFAYATITDPLTGNTDGIMRRCRETDTCPKIMHLDGEFEVWGARGSLLVSDGDPAGPNPVEIPDDVRLYMVAGTPHGGAGTIVPNNPTFDICKNLLNSNGSTAVYRALVVALNEWITTGRKPPKSRYGSVGKGKEKGKDKTATLVSSDQDSTGFPDIPGVTYNGIFNSIRVTDYTVQPPFEGAEYAVRVPRVDADGNSLAGIRLPTQEAPIATYTGWNLRAPGFAEDEACSSRGSYIPFAATRAERMAIGDPRLSIQERYKSRKHYLKRFSNAAHKLVKQRFLLPADAEELIQQAEALDLPLN